MEIRTAYRFEVEAYNQLVDTEDRREGILAFNEKRSRSSRALRETLIKSWLSFREARAIKRFGSPRAGMTLIELPS
jgi:hypothetical protein